MKEIVSFYRENGMRESHYSLILQAMKKFDISYFLAEIGFQNYISELILEN